MMREKNSVYNIDVLQLDFKVEALMESYSYHSFTGRQLWRSIRSLHQGLCKIGNTMGQPLIKTHFVLFLRKILVLILPSVCYA